MKVRVAIAYLPFPSLPFSERRIYWLVFLQNSIAALGSISRATECRRFRPAEADSRTAGASLRLAERLNWWRAALCNILCYALHRLIPIFQASSQWTQWRMPRNGARQSIELRRSSSEGGQGCENLSPVCQNPPAKAFLYHVRLTVPLSCLRDFGGPSIADAQRAGPPRFHAYCIHTCI